MANKIKINNKTFLTLNEAYAYTREFLTNLYEQDNRVITSTHEEWDFLYALILRHPCCKQQIGIGIKAFLIIRKRIENITLDILRTDYTRINISWRCCVRAKDGTMKENLRSAMRIAVRSQIHEFRKQIKPTQLCEFCNTELGDKEINIHHAAPTFKEMSDNFLIMNRPPTKFHERKPPKQPIFRNEDSEFEFRWENYHREHCNLTVLHRDCHYILEKTLRRKQ